MSHSKCFFFFASRRSEKKTFSNVRYAVYRCSPGAVRHLNEAVQFTESSKVGNATVPRRQRTKEGDINQYKESFQYFNDMYHQVWDIINGIVGFRIGNFPIGIT